MWLGSCNNGLFVSLVFLTSSSATRLYRGRVPRLTSDNSTCCHTRQGRETRTSVSAGHIILTPSQSVEPTTSSPGSHALPTELPRPPALAIMDKHGEKNGYKYKDEPVKKIFLK